MRIDKEKLKIACNNVHDRFKMNKYFKFSDLQEAIEKSIELINYNTIKGKFHYYFKEGNLKLGDKVLIWSMPSGIACGCCCKGCYAQKAERQYKNSRIMRLYNMILIEYALIDEDFKKLLQFRMAQELKFKSVSSERVLRIHESGDFYKKEYFNFWLEIIEDLKEYKNLKIYTYTKMLSYKEIEEINNKYNNFNIISSYILIDGKLYLNFGTSEYLDDLEKILIKHGIKYYRCKYSTKKQKAKEENEKNGIKDMVYLKDYFKMSKKEFEIYEKAKIKEKICMVTCFKCLNNTIVLFELH